MKWSALAVVLVMSVPQLAVTQGSAEALLAKHDLRHLITAVNLFKLERGRLPANDEGLAILVPSPTSRRPAYLTRIPVDPWGRAYLYATPGRAGDFDVYTLGADGREGGEGDDADIGSWLGDALEPPR